MIKIPENCRQIFKLLHEQKSEVEINRFIFIRLLKHLAVGLISSFLIGLVSSYYLLPTLGQPQTLVILLPVFILIGIISAHLAFKNFSTEKKIHHFARRVFDNSLSSIGNEHNTFISRYLIDYLILQTTMFDHEIIKDKDYAGVAFSELRQNILKKYRPTRTPHLPYRTPESKQYLIVMSHAFQQSQLSTQSYRSLISKHFG